MVQNPPTIQSENIKCDGVRVGDGKSTIDWARDRASNLKYQANSALPERNHTIPLLRNLTPMCRSYLHTRTILC
ncbi:MAG: hypothetical protein ICV52_07625 [Microcoleus sp. C1-bin4]|nr:hypothetical protein [Microcoleus sp. C1-bin4]